MQKFSRMYPNSEPAETYHAYVTGFNEGVEYWDHIIESISHEICEKEKEGATMQTSYEKIAEEEGTTVEMVKRAMHAAEMATTISNVYTKADGTTGFTYQKVWFVNSVHGVGMAAKPDRMARAVAVGATKEGAVRNAVSSMWVDMIPDSF